MEGRKYRFSEIGMLMGLLIGGAAGAIMFIITGDVFYFVLLSSGLALGIGIGSAYDGRKDAYQQRQAIEKEHQ